MSVNPELEPVLDQLPDDQAPSDSVTVIASQRVDIARKLLDVLALPAGQVNDNERAFTGDMLNELLNFVPETLRIEVGRRLAEVLTPPTSLLRRLMLEPFAVAGPLLKSGKEIPDFILAEACQVSPAHREAIARRPRVGDMVADALLASEEAPVVQTVLTRLDVTVSEARIDRLVKMSVEHPSIRHSLLSRAELQPRHGFTMFWWLDSNERRRVLNRFTIDRALIQTALKPLYAEVFPDPDPDIVVKRVLTLCDRRHRPRGRNGEAVSIDLVERMLISARANPTAELCHTAGLLAGVSPDTAARVLHDHGGEPFAILCKSIGVSRQAFGNIMEKAITLPQEDAQGPRFDEAKADHLLGVFDTLARDYARTVLRYWDWRPESYSFGTFKP